MESRISRFILRFSKREQIALLAITACSMPLLYVSLDLPKTIINEAIAGSGFPKMLFGRELEQIPYLVVLCCVFLALVMVNGALKYCVNVYKGIVGERMLRRLRYQLFHSVLRFPQHQFRRTSQGEVVSMITAETEPLGGFVGDAVAVPAFQGGTLITILIFMFVQDWVLGLAAITLYPLQMWLIPKLQRKVNALRKERIVKVRALSERIGEVVGGMSAVHANAVAQAELADFSTRAGSIFETRLKLYKLKFLIKFLNNFIAQITPFFFYLIGGILVIKGDLTFGALVAVLAAYKDLNAPWKELLNYYQTASDARVKYALLRERFVLPDLAPESMLEGEPKPPLELSGELVARNLPLGEMDGSYSAITSFRLDLPRHVALVGPSSGGKETLAGILGGTVVPNGGSLTIGTTDLLRAPMSARGRSIGFVGREPQLRSGTLLDNLMYALKRYPITASGAALAPAAETTGDAEADAALAAATARRLNEARKSGNSEFSPDGEWVDYAAIGASGPAELVDRAVDALRMVGMDGDLLDLGLRSAAGDDDALAARLLEARTCLRERLAEGDDADLVAPFDAEQYNENLSVAENVVFGAARNRRSGAAMTAKEVVAGTYVMSLLERYELVDDMVRIGVEVARLMVELFGDMEASDDVVQRFSFISLEDLPAYRDLLARIDREGTDTLAEDERAQLIALAMQLQPKRHRLGLIDETLRKRLLDMRAAFAAGVADVPEAGVDDAVDQDVPLVDLFDRARFNRAVSVQDNILFGRVVYGRARAEQTVGQYVRDVIDELDLWRPIAEVGLQTNLGIGGSRLASAQRQKVNIARVLLKQPDVLVFDDATASLDPRSAALVMSNVLEAWAKRSVFWVFQDETLASCMHYKLVIEQGQVVEQGSIDGASGSETINGNEALVA